MSVSFPRLDRPILSSPMAGGPTTPELVAAVSNAGGIGLVAGAYRTAEDLADQITRTRALTDRGFGVNLFVPTPIDRERDEPSVRAYAALLADFAGPDVQPGTPRWDDHDHFDDKVDLLVQQRVPLVTFMFGVPDPKVIERLHESGSCLMVTVTDAQEAQAAAEAGADALCVQGTQAGGHRGTHEVAATPNGLNWQELLPQVQDLTSLPLVVAGGIISSEDVAQALGQGAIGAQCGTAFLLTDEAGTSAPHRAGLSDPQRTSTLVTRAFSGRPARALTNAFTERLDPVTPAVYPMVNHLTKPVRAAAAAAGDPDRVSLWAGTGWREIHGGSAADVVVHLCP
ncbi:nitronate monooxygenase [Leekyejoonella antrihumi]|uniref:Propionate 3-nitronate monooxygenase n=1 Tax=Leekyejoonella antrihumi TaxID=1660198 RepID=A0A563DVU2_9MICO|nr:nitronate monooxygenase [Leekyejoonella antrihumi]TWP34062.1 2-nitropropane dioxygenase [Leekyejoonella antrihumi]